MAGNVRRRRPVLAVRSRFGAAGVLSRLGVASGMAKNRSLLSGIFQRSSRKYFFRLAAAGRVPRCVRMAGRGAAGAGLPMLRPCWGWAGRSRVRVFPEHYRTGAETVCIMRGASAANSGKGLLPEYLFFFGKKV